MSFEEQAEFLMQSIASHDRQIGELTDGLGQTRSLLNDSIAESRETTKEMRETTKEMKLAISRLATAMHGLNEHSADHKARIERLEEGRL
jgi:methyl-accepting chemotaxis protein